MNGLSTSTSLDLLIPALLSCQKKISGVAKKGKNPRFGHGYATFDDILAAVRGPLHDNGLVVIQAPIPNERPGYIALETRLFHTSGQWIASVIETPLPKADPQGVGSAITYSCRYALVAMLQIPQAQSDDDGNEASFQPGASAAKQQDYTDARDAKAREVSTIAKRLGLSEVEFRAIAGIQSTRTASLDELIVAAEQLRLHAKQLSGL